MEEKAYYKMGIEEVIKDISSSEKGISNDESIKRRSIYGLNELPSGKRTSLIKLFFEQFKDILILILVVAVVIEFVLYFLGYEPDLTDAIAIGAFLFINSAIGLVSEYRSEKSMAALKRITAEQARVIRPEGEQLLDSKLLVPGDIIYIEMGNKVPADARLIEVMNLQVDESSLTGESRAVKKRPAVINKSVALGDRLNMVFSGTIATYGRGTAVIVATGSQTQIGRIAQLLTEIEEAETPLQRKMAKVGFQLGILIIVVCIIVFIVGLIKTLILQGSLGPSLVIEFLMASVALAVAAMPSGLPIVITTSLALGMRELAQEGALVKRLKAVETLGSVNVICSDKTGTLTKNEMTIRLIYTNNNVINVSGVGYFPEGEFYIEKSKKFNPLEDRYVELILRIGALCGTSTIEKKENQWIIIGDPTEGSMLTVAMKAGINIPLLKKTYPQIGEIPFTSELKRMTTIHKTPDNEVYAYIKGALDIILDRCSSIYVDGKIKPLTKEDRAKILKLNEEYSSQQLRIIAMAQRTLQSSLIESYEGVDTDLTFIGFVGMMDPPREAVPPAIIECKRAGIEIKMITGDHPATANAIAKEIGLISPGEEQNTILGLDFYKKTKEEIENAKIFARISPENKLDVVKILLEKDYIVAVTGDGVNDAPALKSANIGVAMGVIGTDVAKEAADMTLTDDNFATIVDAVRKGRNVFESIIKTIFYLLSCNIGEILVLFVWIIIGTKILPTIPSLLPLLPLQLLWVNLITDSLPALSLAKEPFDPRLMEQTPRRVDEPIFTRRITINIILIGTLICIGTLILFYWGLERGIQIWGTGDSAIEERIYSYATSMAFMTVIMFENWNIYCSRSLKNSIFKIKTTNYYMHLAIGIAILLQLITLYIPPLNPVFHTYPIGIFEWVLIIAVSSSIVWLTEAYKVFWKWWDKRHSEISKSKE